MTDRTWKNIHEVYQTFGYKSLKAAQNAISADRFPVDTYVLSGRRVVDVEVMDAFFSAHRERGLKQLKWSNVIMMTGLIMISKLAEVAAKINDTDFNSEFKKELFLVYPVESVQIFNTVDFYGLDREDVLMITNAMIDKFLNRPQVPK